MHSMVAALLDEVKGEWKADLVRWVFLPYEAQAILSRGGAKGGWLGGEGGEGATAPLPPDPSRKVP